MGNWVRTTHRYSYAKVILHGREQVARLCRHTLSHLFQMPRSMAQNLPVSLSNSTTEWATVSRDHGDALDFRHSGSGPCSLAGPFRIKPVFQGGLTSTIIVFATWRRFSLCGW